jgi:AraC-like DNA-binding protein
VLNPTVAVHLLAADARASVAAGAHPWFTVRHHTSVDQLFDTLRTVDVALVVIDAADAQCRSMASVIATIRQSFPTIPVLAYCAMTGGRSSTVVDAVRAGATGLLLRGIDDARHAMRAAITSARRASVAQRVHDEVALHLPAVAHPLLLYAVTRSIDDPSVKDAAASLGVDRKTLFNWLRNAGGVRPREFINWVRLSIVVGLLEDPGRTAEQVALQVGFSSGTAFRNMLQRYTGLSSSKMRGEHGLARILALFLAELTAETDDGSRRLIPVASEETPVSARRAVR